MNNIKRIESILEKIKNDMIGSTTNTVIKVLELGKVDKYNLAKKLFDKGYKLKAIRNEEGNFAILGYKINREVMNEYKERIKNNKNKQKIS